MIREVHGRFWESAGLRCPAPLNHLLAFETGSDSEPAWQAGSATTMHGNRTPPWPDEPRTRHIGGWRDEPGA
jgi:hypothetical protein